MWLNRQQGPMNLMFNNFTYVEVAAKSENDISCALCMTVMEVLDATITDPTNEQEVLNWEGG